MMHKAVLFENLEKNAVRCQACAHYCHIAKDTAGICGVRYNDDGKLYLSVYGRPISINIDPIEKKPLFHFLPGTEIFSIGTVGCNFGCDFCQNWEISQARRNQPSIQKNLAEEWPPEKIVDYCLEKKIPSIAYTYNEPSIFAEYVYDTARLAKEKGLRNVLVSNGYQSAECLNYLAPVIDAINVDLKSWSEEFYSRHCKARLNVVKENIKLWKDKGVWVELTTLVIPGRNDSVAEFTGIADYIVKIDRGMPWHVSRFFPHYKLADLAITPLDILIKAHDIGKQAGLKYVYIDNIPADEYSYTFCPKCNIRLITGHDVEMPQVFVNDLLDGTCPKCREPIEGVWK